MKPQAGMQQSTNAYPQFIGSMNVRGVVTAVYFADDQDDRKSAVAPDAPNIKCLAVDVLTYGGRNRAFLSKVPIVFGGHSLNDIRGGWTPRPATKDLSTGQPPSYTRGSMSDPRDLDGDHVLVEFFENDPQQPFVRSTIQHPRAQYRLLRATSDERRDRFRGVETSIDKDGNIVIDTVRANSGDVDANGAETPANDSSHGNFTLKINTAAKVFVQDSGGTNLMTIDPEGPGVTVTFGDGALNAMIFQHFETWWNTVAFPAIQAAFDTHVHPTGVGPTGSPAPLFTTIVAAAGTVATAIRADKLKLHTEA